MGYQIEMGKFDSFYDLLKEQPDFILSKIVLLNVLVKLTPFCHLHHHKDVAGSIQYLIQLYYVWVVDELKNLYLTSHLYQASCTFEIIFLFFIFSLLMIFTATGKPVNSCRASTC